MLAEEAPWTADSEHLGTSEERWRSVGLPERLAPVEAPMNRHAVVVAPHPDDEVLGAGGLVAALAERGAHIEVVAVTDGESSHPGSPDRRHDLARQRREETSAALARLGCPDAPVHRLCVPDGNVACSEPEVARQVQALLRPGSICVSPWTKDGHPDHDASGRAAERAAQEAGVPCWQYLVWAWHWADPESADLPWGRLRRLTLEDGQWSAKCAAVMEFKSQIHPLEVGPESHAVLPAGILSRFWRRWEAFVL